MKSRISLLLPLVASAASAFSQGTVSSALQANDDLQAIETLDSIAPAIDSTYFTVRDIPEILSSLGKVDFHPTPINKVFGPWVFSGYRTIPVKDFAITELPVWVPGMKVMTFNPADSVVAVLLDENGLPIPTDSTSLATPVLVEEIVEEVLPDYPILHGDGTPLWLRDALTQYRIQENFMYALMVSEPGNIEFSYWDLPERPRLPEDDVSYAAFIKKLDLPEVGAGANIAVAEVNKIHWLHKYWANLHFSQAFVSKNWYQGGNNNLSLQLGLGWSVDLNQVFHPNLLFQSSATYKLGLNTVQNDQYRKYSISEDLLQLNLNSGLKAFKKWYYSCNMMFKTQLFNNFPFNSDKRKASFLSPGDFNVGLGMAYDTQNKKKTFKLTANISAFSYNLKTCIVDNSVIPHDRFNIKPSRYVSNAIGSNAEIKMSWKIAWNINYNTRLFLFSDYKYILGDWQNTIDFSVNKFLSTQIFVHMRYDSSVDPNTSWKKFMMKDILSFGLTYTFSTKP